MKKKTVNFFEAYSVDAFFLLDACFHVMFNDKVLFSLEIRVSDAAVEV